MRSAVQKFLSSPTLFIALQRAVLGCFSGSARLGIESEPSPVSAARPRLSAMGCIARRDRHAARAGAFRVRRKLDAEPGGRSECRSRFPFALKRADGSFRTGRACHAPAAAIHASACHADGADRRLQPAPQCGPAVVPLVVAAPGPAGHLRALGRRKN